MKRTKIAFAALMFTMVVSVLSCKKDSNTNNDADTDVSGASDNALAENTSNDIVSIASQSADNTSLTLSTFRSSDPSEDLSSCATVSRDTVTKIVTVTFNNSTCVDGRTRNGSLVFNYSASTNGAVHYRDPGFTCSVTSNNYIVDGNQVSILSKTITNTTPVGFNPASTNETWNITANISIVKASGATVSWTCNRVKTLLNTSTTYTDAATPIDWHNARIGITGTANGTRANGETFTANVTSQLIRDFGGCNINGRHPFIQGTLTYSPTGKATRYFDYGSGTCDLDATVTINGVPHPITLP